MDSQQIKAGSEEKKMNTTTHDKTADTAADTVYTLFRAVAEAHAQEPAIIENDRTMTFGDLSNLVDRIACRFPQEIHSIGIVMRHRAEMIASILFGSSPERKPHRLLRLHGR